MKSLLKDNRGSSVIEMAMVLPLLVVIVLGVVEVSYALLDQHVVTKLTREGSNLISRETSLADATNALKSMSGRPVNFSTNSKVIFSVVRRGATTGTNNYDKDVLYQRYEYGAIAGASRISTRGAGSYGAGPEYAATNADGDSNIQVTNMPAGVVLSTCGTLYITEIFSTHELITPFDKFGVTVPKTLYSIAYF